MPRPTPQTLDDQFRSLIADWLAKTGMSQSDLGRAIDWGPSQVNDILHARDGRSSRLRTVDRIADGLGVEAVLTFRKKSRKSS
jgi:transcriptional regulator with XRE-family HTH domain